MFNPVDGLMHMSNGKVFDPIDGSEVESYSAKMVAPSIIQPEGPTVDLH